MREREKEIYLPLKQRHIKEANSQSARPDNSYIPAANASFSVTQADTATDIHNTYIHTWNYSA